jgi:transcription factor IIIB 90 kDa subunit
MAARYHGFKRSIS